MCSLKQYDWRNLMEIDIILNALFIIIGVVVGSTLQYWFSKASEAQKHQQNLKTEAYVDFLRGTSGISIAQKNKNLKKEEEFTMLLTDAKARIAVYGGKEVIESIANFWRGGATLDTQDRFHSFIDICQAIRNESLPKEQSVLDKEISQLLFSVD